ncbi:MAG TPA: HNH endonuclease signature motif containing protein [Candidatus Paceibacterota bacterium]
MSTTTKRKEKRTYADRAAYMIQAVTKRRRKLKAMVIEYKGGKCIVCGYARYFGAFDLHHTGDSPKSFGLSTRGLTRSWEKTKNEADKCVLLCATCHREVHGGIVKIPKQIIKK